MNSSSPDWSSSNKSHLRTMLLTFLPSHLLATITTVSWMCSIFSEGFTFMGECWKVTIYPSSSPIMFLSFPDIPFWTFHYFFDALWFFLSITLSTMILHWTTLSCYPWNQLRVSTTIPIYYITYLFFTVAYPYNRLELQYQLLPPKPTETYPYNRIVDLHCGAEMVDGDKSQYSTLPK